MPSAKFCLAIVVLSACGAGARPAPVVPAPAPAPTPATAITLPPPAPPKPELTGPVHERAKQLRRAGDLLDQAQQALDLGNRNNADILFSTAELLVGAEAVASLAPRFREGAPPRVTSPIETVALDQPAQPAAVGNSDDDEAAEAVARKLPPKPPARGSLSGTLTIGGQAGGGLALVTLEPRGRAWKPRAPRQRVMEQRERTFAPKLMLVPTGSTVTFPNFDTIFHNVFSTSQPGAFDLGLYRQGETRAVTFAKEGIVRLGCNIHSNMSATIVVIGAPHYVIPDGAGAFTFKSLAPGTYTLRAWSERSKAPITQEITIRAGANTIAVGVDGDAPPGVLDDKFGAARGK